MSRYIPPEEMNEAQIREQLDAEYKVVMFEDFYIELFEDAAGNYFTVLYQLSGCQHHTITPVSARAAQQFLERFGSRA